MLGNIILVLGEVLTASVTPFDADGSVNLTKFRELASYLVENGSDGLVVTGTTGEAPTLIDEERLELYAAAVDAVGDRATVVAGTGTYDTRHSVHLTEMAHELGVDGFLRRDAVLQQATAERHRRAREGDRVGHRQADRLLQHPGASREPRFGRDTR